MAFPVLLRRPKHPLLATARKMVQTEWTSGLTLHVKGENCVFPPAWGMPVPWGALPPWLL